MYLIERGPRAIEPYIDLLDRRRRLIGAGDRREERDKAEREKERQSAQTHVSRERGCDNGVNRVNLGAILNHVPIEMRPPRSILGPPASVAIRRQGRDWSFAEAARDVEHIGGNGGPGEPSRERSVNLLSSFD